MDALAATARHALEEARLGDVLEDVKRRVLDRPVSELSEATRDTDGTWRLAYKPMIELLLHEVRHMARAPHFAVEERRSRIRWALTMAGV